MIVRRLHCSILQERPSYVGRVIHPSEILGGEQDNAGQRLQQEQCNETYEERTTKYYAEWMVPEETGGGEGKGLVSRQPFEDANVDLKIEERLEDISIPLHA
ncbi:hypothetical protein PAXRUDRAFT_29249 [Paxillus rubicundulus Ve08.2h10]|uniref:Uncharacterized protein n=1 Tax=Paxillus rubicundulus Ve08.2h10 TaxID=930991 RepID=A0A0D0D8S7_9AGAM|nr:hypothetical protein PAXRUDRAFT_29249 [Paxillus rubicundulus Ve08.2h10]